MLLWSRPSKALAWAVFAAVFTAVVLAPLVMLVLASCAGSWSGALPTAFTGAHYTAALSGESLASLSVSVQTGLIASAGSVLIGTWAVLAAEAAPKRWRAFVDALFHLPIAVPSVVFGLALLVAFSQPPLPLNGTRWIVLLAHLVIVLPFTYSTVAAAAQDSDPNLPLVAESLGARGGRVLLTVRLPVLLPAIAASASLALALSLGELGATLMLYPPDWQTVPARIFGLTDRGQAFLASASTVVLLATTLVGVTVLGLAKGRAAER